MESNLVGGGLWTPRKTAETRRLERTSRVLRAWRWRAVIVMKRSCISLCGQPQISFVSCPAAPLAQHALQLRFGGSSCGRCPDAVCSGGSVVSGSRRLANFKGHSCKRGIAKLLHEERSATEAGCVALGVNFLPRARRVELLRYILQPRLSAAACSGRIQNTLLMPPHGVRWQCV